MPGTIGYPVEVEASALWHDPGSLLRIEYMPSAMESIRTRAVGEQAVGGLLLGERAGAHVRILDSVELPCAQTRGASFRLTPEERLRGRELVETARLQVVGWYLSRASEEPGLTGEDLEVYRELFPAQWQITLVLRVCADGGVTAAFYSPARTGDLAKGGEHVLPALFSESPMKGRITHPVAKPVSVTDLKSVSRWDWIVRAVIALLLGAAAFEAQTLWQLHQAAAQAVQQPPASEVP